MAHPIIAELRQQREARGLESLALSRRTGVRISFLTSIDRGDVGALPAGLYGRAAVRAYAAGVGIDPDSALTALAPHLRVLEDPIDGLARVRGISRPVPSRSSVTIRTEEPRHLQSAQVAPVWPPLAASLCDSVLLAVIDLMLLALTAIACGTTMEITLLRAGPALILLWALIGCAYYLLLGGIRGAPSASDCWSCRAPTARCRSRSTLRGTAGQGGPSSTAWWPADGSSPQRVYT